MGAARRIIPKRVHIKYKDMDMDDDMQRMYSTQYVSFSSNEKEEISEDIDEKEETSEEVNETSNTVDAKNFKLHERAEKTLDSYISKIDEYYSKIDEEKIDVITQKSKVLEAILNTDMLHTK